MLGYLTPSSPMKGYKPMCVPFTNRLQFLVQPFDHIPQNLAPLSTTSIITFISYFSLEGPPVAGPYQ